MYEEQLKALCKKLKPLISNSADILWLDYVTSENYQAKQLAESRILTFASIYISDSGIFLPPPSKNDCRGDFLLGNVFYGNKFLHQVFLTREDFIKHLSVMAITGAGKTTICQNLLLQLLENKIPFAVVDWKRSYRDLLSLKRKDVKNIKIYSIGRNKPFSLAWNPLRPPPNIDIRTWLNIVVESMEKSHLSGPGVADVLLDIIDKKFDDFGFYSGSADEGHYPNFFDVREEVEKSTYTGRRSLWRDSALRILRGLTFGNSAYSFNARDPIKLELLFDEPIIIELDLELSHSLRTYFTELFLRFLHLYRLGQGETNQLRHVLFLEEAHNLFSQGYAQNQHQSSIETCTRELRGFGQSLVFIDQIPSKIPVSVLGNMNNQIYLSLQHADDVVTASKALGLSIEEKSYLDWLKVGEGIVKIKGRVKPTLVRFPNVPIKKGIITDEVISKFHDS